MNFFFPKTPKVPENQHEDKDHTRSSTTSTSKAVRTIKKKKRTQSSRANLVFPVGRVLRQLKTEYTGRDVTRIAPAAGVYLTSVLEYLSAEVLELAARAAHVKSKSKRPRIKPNHILLAVRNDEELNKMLNGSYHVSESGVVSRIHPYSRYV